MHADGVAIDPSRALQAMMAGEKPGGHGERCVAVGALDMAIWDAVAKARGLPLYRLLARDFGNLDALSSIPVYAGGGYYFPDNDLGQLRAEAQYFRDLGFLSAKIKIGALDIAIDCTRIETALDVLGSGSNLAVDAVYSYAPQQALDIARAIEPYGLRWFEDICDPLDYETLANVVRAYQPAISAGEATFSLSDARNLLRYAGLRSGRDVLTFDPAHCYGISEFVRIIRRFEENGWAANSFLPHSGHIYGLHLAAGLRLGGCECNPHNFQPFGGFADDTVIRGSLVSPQAAPGWRPWLYCPGCRRRCRCLYGANTLRCRKCLGLVYTSQSERRHWRALRRADSIRRCMAGTAYGIDPAFPPKPLHMC